MIKAFHMVIVSCFLSVAVALAADRVPIGLIPVREATTAVASMEIDCGLPGQVDVYLAMPEAGWIGIGAIAFEVAWPADAPTNAQVMVTFMDHDYLWYQHELDGYLHPGRTNAYTVDISAEAPGWEPRNHAATWHYRTRLDPREVAVRVYGAADYEGAFRIANVRGILEDRTDAPPPVIRNVRVTRAEIPVYDRFELTFELPDRYRNPFDEEEVLISATFVAPSGAETTVEGYYARHYYRTVGADGERIVPQGPPFWQVRFTPREEGLHRYTLRAFDTWGETRWGPATFDAAPPRRPGFVRVARKDPRHFEFSGGAYFFPIGHNIRSPFDMRVDSEFPWRERHAEGSAAYARYFRDMEAHGETLAEVWTASWSLGLEWLADWPGYHGIGQYNLRHAWELDRVFALAEAHGIYINLVIHNHGKYSSFSDKEWAYNPFNVKNGGYLESPLDFFSDERAVRDFLRLMRYMIARWGSSTHLFAWQLWSELDLVGNKSRSTDTPACLEWHRTMGRAIKAMDPYDHPVATHWCGTYSHQYPDVIALPEIDHCPVDAYHGSQDPTKIVDLLRQTCEHNNPLGKPVLATEFGGSARAASIPHLDESLHLGLWASTSLPLAATPLFWWWQIIEEENFYPKFRAVSRFMHGEDRRDPALVPGGLRFAGPDGKPAAGFDGLCLASPERAYGWIYRKDAFSGDGEWPSKDTTNLVVCLDGLTNGAFRVEFWDTEEGVPVSVDSVDADGSVALNMPPFTRDMAFKVKRAN